MTKLEVAEIFSILMLAYPRAEMFKGGMERMAPTIALWAGLLDDMDFRIAQKAVVAICKNCTFPPTIAEFRAAVKEETEKEDSEVLHQWLAVRTVLSFKNSNERMALLSDRASTVVKALGGIEELNRLEGIGAYNAFTAKYREMQRNEKPEIFKAFKQIGGR